MKKLHPFFSNPVAGQELRQASLVLQFTGGEAFMSAKPEEGAPPKAVALLMRKAHRIADERLQRLLGALHSDPDLNLGAATGALLATAGDLLARLDAYLLCPHRFASMCAGGFLRRLRRRSLPSCKRPTKI